MTRIEPDRETLQGTTVLVSGGDRSASRQIALWLDSDPHCRYRVLVAETGQENAPIDTLPSCVVALCERPEDLDEPPGAGFDLGGKRVPLIAIATRPGIETELRRRGAHDVLGWEELTPGLLRRVVEHVIERGRWYATVTERDALYRALINTAVDAIITFDEEGTILSFNPAAEPLFGYPAEEAIGMNIEQLIPSLLAQLETGSNRARPETRTAGRGFRQEAMGLRADRRPFAADITVSRLTLAGSGLFTCIVRDVSERKRMERQIQQRLARAESRLAQNERMAALGTIGAGVAHELNNPLMGLLNELQFALTRAGEQDRELREALTHALDDARRCKAIVRDLLSYARSVRPGEVDVTEDVGETVRQVIRDLESDLREAGIGVTLRLDPASGPVAIGSTQLRQVLSNLVLNARDAMRDSPRRLLTIASNAHDNAVVVFVQDTGPGMTEEQRSRVFEPFFTTKAPGRGTGLGLFLCRNLVESAGGRMTVVSTPGVGSTFVAVLPRLQLPPGS